MSMVAAFKLDVSGETLSNSGLGNVFRHRGGEDDEKIRVAEELREEAKEALEWRAVCSQLSAFASTAAALEVCRNGMIPVGRDRAESQKLLDQTAAAVALAKRLDFVGVEDVSEIVRTAVNGEVLIVRELCAVKRSLASARGVFEQLMLVSSMVESPDRLSTMLFSACC